MNWIFAGLVVISVVAAAFTGRMQALTEASVTSAKAAVELSISLVGQMALWLGFVGVLKQAGLMAGLARLLKPLMTRLFPDVPPEHPAMGAMIMNIVSNLLGLGNAATPFGLKAMLELDSLNQKKGVATNAMVTFLAINTAGLTLLPLNVIALRATAGSVDPAGIILPTILATLFTTTCAVLAAKLLQGRQAFAVERFAEVAPAEALKAPDADALAKAEALAAIETKAPLWRQLVAAAIGAAIVFALVRHALSQPAEAKGFEVARAVLSGWLLPLLMLSIVTVGFARQVKVYEAFIGAAKEGFTTSVAIIPFLVAMLVCIGLFRASGAMGVLLDALTPLLSPIGFPSEALPMALLRPLSGSGALGVLTDTLKKSGPDSFVGYLVSVLYGTTETTFYVLALYFGVVQVRAVRHALAACVVADVLGPLGALFICRFFFAGIA
ncbi:MAG: spore maturation protein [Myxococcales bacterium]|nr:spore maturation protein [Myxococcales bacterium]